MIRIKGVILFFLISLMIVEGAWGQQFGRNKVQYVDLDWKYIQSEHFDFYYYQGGRNLAEFAAAVAESSFISLNELFNYKLIDRIPVIIYRSHNDFSETNTSRSVIPESVGGFTEFLKNRVVLPFEGSYEQFRHVIHHELTHAVMLQFLYGAGPGSIIGGISRMSPPLWFIEGLAEYTSIGWDTDSDMFVRDATVRGYLPPIPYLQAFLAYKGGQAVLRYIEDTYGRPKISELLQRMRTTRNFEKAWESTINEPLEESNKKWQRYMRKLYWPDIADRKEPSDYAESLTDHTEWRNFVNNSPAVSPSGDRVAFLSDKSGYFDIYMVSAIDPEETEKLVSGQRKSDLEELNWLQPGMSWSNDGKYIAFAARSGRRDALNILDVKQKNIVHAFKFDIDAIAAPAWSPVSNEIAFVGMKNYRSDIYVYNMDSETLSRLTDDIFSDAAPAWSPDGAMLAFESDRKDFVNMNELTGEINIAEYNYHTTDIYLIHRDGSGMRRLTNGFLNETSPQWTNDPNQLLYISDETGIANIYAMDLRTGTSSVLTNLLTGCAQISWGLNSDRLAFTAFSNGGYDIYFWPDPFSSIYVAPNPEHTLYVKKLQRVAAIPEEDYDKQQMDEVKNIVKSQQDYTRYVFDRSFRKGVIDVRDETTHPVKLNEEEYKDEAGEFIDHDYRVKFSIDNAGLNAGYDPFWGVYGLTQIYLSDVLGDHQIQIGANIIRNFADSDLLLGYQNLKNRINWGASAYQFVNFYATTFGTARFVNRGAGVQSFYPFSRFRRINVGMQFVNIVEENISFMMIPRRSFSLLLPSLSYTTDNSLWGYTGPARGRRNYIGVTGSPKLGNTGKEFVTASFDMRQYFTIVKDYSVALRVTGGASFGKNPTLFLIGGVDNWLNYRFDDKIDAFSVQDYFLSNLLTPLRGANYYEMMGTRALLMNMEFRFPFIQYLIARFPLPLGFHRIEGIGFLDAGSAWVNDEAWRFSAKKNNGDRFVRDITTGFGYGLRINLYMFLLKIDIAYKTDFDYVSKPRIYYSIGIDF